jgi:hypothetical protein
MKKVIVCTSINAPTEAIRKFDELPGWVLVVVGDKKSPQHYSLRHGVYLSCEDQDIYAPEFSRQLGWTKVERRMIGFIYAHNELRADIVATVDDDNIPFDNWGLDIYLGKKIRAIEYQTQAVAFDPLSVTKHADIWHRGFPIELVDDRIVTSESLVEREFDVQANLWNGDPDIYAMTRMEQAPHCEFDSDLKPYCSNRVSPFNSQNTLITRRALPYYFFPSGANQYGRVSDIWAGYHVLAQGFKAVYAKPTVFHARNEHDLQRDHQDELPLYEQGLKMVNEIESSTYEPQKYWSKNDLALYALYQAAFKD